MTQDARQVRRCTQCGLPQRVEPTTTDYRESGLDNVQLINVPMWVCHDGHEEIQIPAVNQLHVLLTHLIMRKPARLTGKEIRFLRTELGFSSKQFAERIALTPVHLSRLETGSRRTNRRMDLLVRLSVAAEFSTRENKPFPPDLGPLVTALEQAWDIGSHRVRHLDDAPRSINGNKLPERRRSSAIRDSITSCSPRKA